MASGKLHIGKFSNKGTESCDFRGDKFIGKDQGDHHATVLEKDPLSEFELNLILTEGPNINKALSSLDQVVATLGMEPSKGIEILGELRGEETGLSLRIGVWDN